MTEKTKGVFIDAAVYAIAFGTASLSLIFIGDIFAAAAAFMSVATVVVFAASCIFSDVSVYDPYWSVAPPVILFACMLKYGFYNANAVILLAVVCVWSARLTVNWYYTYKGLGHEDWRYAMYRERYRAPAFLFVSFTGLHFVPTVVVYAGLVSGLFAMQEETFSPLSAVGVAVMLGAVALEYISDRAIHRFLREHKGERITCGVSVWKYSRHPNYLGEISFWTGMYIYFAAACPDIWYRGLSFLAVPALFCAVSIPMMEKHNAARRADYAEYKAKTSVLLLLPPKSGKRRHSADK